MPLLTLMAFQTLNTLLYGIFPVISISMLPSSWDFCRAEIDTVFSLFLNSGSYIAAYIGFTLWFANYVLRDLKAMSKNEVLPCSRRILAIAVSLVFAHQALWPALLVSTHFIASTYYPRIITGLVIYLSIPERSMNPVQWSFFPEMPSVIRNSCSYLMSYIKNDHLMAHLADPDEWEFWDALGYDHEFGQVPDRLRVDYVLRSRAASVHGHGKVIPGPENPGFSTQLASIDDYMRSRLQNVIPELGFEEVNLRAAECSRCSSRANCAFVAGKQVKPANLSEQRYPDDSLKTQIDVTSSAVSDGERFCDDDDMWSEFPVDQGLKEAVMQNKLFSWKSNLR